MNLRVSTGAGAVAIVSGFVLGWGCTLQTSGELDVTGGGGAGHDASAGSGGVAGTGHGGAWTGGTAGKAGGGTAGKAGGGTAGDGGSSGAGAGGATGGAAGQGGAGGAVGPEDCSNGTDDNQDSLVDCADPKCAPDFICVPAPPAGWSTVTYERDRSASAAPTDCGALQSSGLSLFHGIDAPTAGCQCACGAATGGQCSGGATLWQNGNCSGGSATQTNGCFDFHANGWTIGGVRTTAATVTTAGTCGASTSGAPQAAAWSSAMDLCRVPALGAGCGAGSVCVPKPVAPLDNLACVEQPGQPACPGDYPLQSFYYESFTDGRACTSSGCSCGAATGQTCDFSVALYTDAACGTAPVGTYPLDGGCHSTGFGNGYIDSSRFVGELTGGSCQASGTSAITGEVTPTAAHTVCCKSL